MKSNQRLSYWLIGAITLFAFGFCRSGFGDTYNFFFDKKKGKKTTVETQDEPVGPSAPVDAKSLEGKGYEFQKSEDEKTSESEGLRSDANLDSELDAFRNRKTVERADMMFGMKVDGRGPWRFHSAGIVTKYAQAGGYLSVGYAVANVVQATAGIQFIRARNFRYTDSWGESYYDDYVIPSLFLEGELRVFSTESEERERFRLAAFLGGIAGSSEPLYAGARGYFYFDRNIGLTTALSTRAFEAGVVWRL